jgi:hypothetical protein
VNTVAFCISSHRILHGLSQWSHKGGNLQVWYSLSMTKTNCTARLATLDQLVQTLIPAYLTPTPSHETLREWFDEARIPRFKANPAAKRGGGPVYYSVAAVEKFLQTRTLPCRLPAATLPSHNSTANPNLN